MINNDDQIYFNFWKVLLCQPILIIHSTTYGQPQHKPFTINSNLFSSTQLLLLLLFNLIYYFLIDSILKGSLIFRSITNKNQKQEKFSKLGSEAVKKMGLTEPKVVTGPGGYVLEDVPHLSDYIPNLPVSVFLLFSNAIVHFLAQSLITFFSLVFFLQ
jgi:hypothetical protein